MNIFTVTKSVQAERPIDYGQSELVRSLFAEAPPDFARDLSSAKVRRNPQSHNRLFMAFVIPHSWYFVARGEQGRWKGDDKAAIKREQCQNRF